MQVSSAEINNLYYDLKKQLLHRRPTYMTSVWGINFIFKNV
jgi:hypothetical protein